MLPDELPRPRSRRFGPDVLAQPRSRRDANPAKPRRKRSAALILGLLLTISGSGCAFFERDDVVILVNASSEVSRAIGAHYAEVRGVPESHVLALSLPTAASDWRISATQFETAIAQPLGQALEQIDPERRVRFLVTTWGLPVRLSPCDPETPTHPSTCSATTVDGALATLGSPGEPLNGRPGPHANPFFGTPDSFDEHRTKRPDSRLRFLVGRLTGTPTPVEPDSGVPRAVLRLLDRATEDPVASPGWRVIGGVAPEARGAAAAALLSSLGERLSAWGIAVCDVCDAPPASAQWAGLIHVSGPTDPAPLRLSPRSLVIDLAPPGSSSAGSSPASRLEARLGKWIERGSAALSLQLDEPTLAGLARPTIQVRAFLTGSTAVEAHWKALPQLGRASLFIGDPLLEVTEPIAPPGSEQDADRDADGVSDVADNCVDTPNPMQRDSDGDRFGNRCDPDVDNDGIVRSSEGKIYPRSERGDIEAIALTARNGPHDPNHDLDGDGRVDDRDLELAQLWLLRAPGPSGLRTDFNSAVR